MPVASSFHAIVISGMPPSAAAAAGSSASAAPICVIVSTSAFVSFGRGSLSMRDQKANRSSPLSVPFPALIASICAGVGRLGFFSGRT